MTRGTPVTVHAFDPALRMKMGMMTCPSDKVFALPSQPDRRVQFVEDGWGAARKIAAAGATVRPTTGSMRANTAKTAERNRILISFLLGVAALFGSQSTL